MRSLVKLLLILVAFTASFFSGFLTSENRNLVEIIDLLESNIRLQVMVNVYQHHYGPLTKKDAEEYLGKRSKSPQENNNDRIGPI